MCRLTCDRTKDIRTGSVLALELEEQALVYYVATSESAQFVVNTMARWQNLSSRADHEETYW